MKTTRISGLLLIPSLLLLLTGCWDSHDLEDIDYISGIGIDYSDNTYHVYAQMLDFTVIARQESRNGTTEPLAYSGQGTGETVSMAMDQLYDTAQQRIVWSHVTAIIVTEAALKHGIQGFADAINRFREIRYTPWIFGTKGNIDELFHATAFYNLSSLSTVMHEPSKTYKQKSWLPPIRLLHFSADYWEPGKTIILPTLGINPAQWEKNQKPDPKLQMNGAFVVRDKAVRGWIGNEDLSGLRWMTSETNRTPLEIREDNTLLAVLSLESPKQEITESFTNGKPLYRIKLTITGNIVEQIHPASEQQLSQIAQSLIQKEVRETFLKALKLKSDVYQLEYFTYLHHPDIWKQLKTQAPFFLTKDSLDAVEVRVKITHSGLLKMLQKSYTR
ncbi:Ger(x)C family spore germination protein [Paenibacillus koleovorans]|uniref:Ger(x)C family spore germination protein n=1 Tax=Paenibacillus koleovorans TaxID=121608 RepID=UPI000FD7B48B|nr:Ger(x)C family spore germination protein [Paenibacillus koleovorans]